jgi:hypothetical protein
MQRHFGSTVAITVAFAVGNVLAADKGPVGPELAPREIGVLLKAYPISVQSNPLSPLGVGTTLWGCDYQVGKAVITITVATQPSDPMPCKRKVAFGESNEAPQK